jgi:hypothetical protein
VSTRRRRAPDASQDSPWWDRFSPWHQPGASEEENGDWATFCPAHEDPATSKKPSAKINYTGKAFKNGLPGWFCFRCVPSGREATLETLNERLTAREEAGEVAVYSEAPPARVYDFKAFADDKAAASGAPTVEGLREEIKQQKPLPDDDTIAAWVDTLLSGTRKAFLNRRGLQDATLKEASIGWNPNYGGGRITIPIYSPEGQLLNVRCYKPRAVKDKMIWHRKGHTQSLYGMQDITHDDHVVYLMEGEWDRLLAKQDGFPAVTHTAGAATFLPEWGEYFRDKTVIVAYDNDDGGRDGREKALAVLKHFAECVVFVDLPEEGTDYTDFRVKMGKSAADFAALVTAAQANPAWQRENKALPLKGEPVTVHESQDAKRNGQPLEIVAHVVGKVDPAYTLPRHVDYTCDQDKGNACKSCPMKGLWGGHNRHEFTADDESLAKMLDATDERKGKLLQMAIDAKCNDHLVAEVESFWSVEQLVVQDTIDGKRDSEAAPIMRDVYHVGDFNTRVNAAARVVGHQIADPRNQRGMFMAWHMEPVETSLDKFEMTPELFEALRVFQTDDDPLDKCYEIATDLGANVTNIIGREELHVALDLVWHSVLALHLNGKPMEKGWLELMVMGDSRTGKSEAARMLSQHYNSGMMFACDQASLAGLVGGVIQPTGKQWQVNWGAIPLNDRRLMVLDESQSLLGKDIVEHMSSIRSSGIAQITKVKSSSTTARTRLIWIANPPGGQQLASLPEAAMEATRQMFPAHEDIARFDFAIAVARGEVSSDAINTMKRTRVPHVYTAALCSSLVTWAWSRKPGQIVWQEGAQAYLMRCARKLGEMYSSDFPLVQAENIRMKLGRLAAAVAARTFSTDDGERLLIGEAHVSAAVKMLHTLYGSESFGYQRLSARMNRDSATADENVGVIRDYLTGNSNKPDGNGLKVYDALTSLGGRFDSRSFSDAGTMLMEEAQLVIRYLEDMRMLRRGRGGRYLEVQRALSELLRAIEDGV